MRETIHLPPKDIPIEKSNCLSGISFWRYDCGSESASNCDCIARLVSSTAVKSELYPFLEHPLSLKNLSCSYNSAKSSASFNPELLAHKSLVAVSHISSFGGSFAFFKAMKA